MMDKSINNRLQSNLAWLSEIGLFIKQSRLEKNKTQEYLAETAGINRSTISQLENGEGCSLATLIQILRALEMLDVLTVFRKKQTFSPIQMARLMGKIPKRARKRLPSINKPKSEW